MSTLNVHAIISANVSQYQAALSSAQAGMKAFTGNSKSKTDAIANGLKGVGKAMTVGVSAPLTVMGTHAVKTFGGFEKQMNRVNAISGATGSDFERLKKKALDLGESTIFSASDVASAMEELASQGMNTDQIMASIKGTMDLAAVSGGDLSGSAANVAAGLKQFGWEAGEAGKLADIYARAAADSAAESADMAAAMSYVGPVAHTAGLGLEETASAVAIMSDNGLKGSRAGMALRQAISRMGAPTDEMKEKMKELGISFFDSEGKMRPFGEIIQELQGKYKGMSKEQQLATSKVLFGQTAMSGMNGLISTGSGKLDEMTNSLKNSEGAAGKMADTINSGFSGAMEELRGKFETFSIMIGDKIAPYIQKFADKIGELLKWFNNLDEGTQNTIVQVGLFLAALGPIVFIFGAIFGPIMKVVGAVGWLWKKFKILKGTAIIASNLGGAIGLIGKAVTFLTGPIGIALAAFTGLFVYLWKTNEGFRNFFIKIWDEITNFFLKTIPEWFNTAVEWIGQLPGKIGTWFSDIYNSVTTWVTETWNSITEWFSKIPETISTAVTDAYNSVVTWFTEMYNSVVEWVTNIWTSVSEWFAKLPETISTAITDAYNAVVTWVTDMWNQATEMASGFLTKIGEFLSELPYKLGEWLGFAIGTVIRWAAEFVTKAHEAGLNFINGVADFIAQLPEKVWTFLSETWTKVSTWATDMWEKAKEMGSKFLSNVVAFFILLPGRIREKVNEVWNKITTWASEMWNKAKETGRTFLNNIMDFFSQLPGKISAKVTEVWNKIKTWATDMWNKATETGREFLNNVIGFFKDLPGKVYEWIKGALDKVLTWGTDMKNAAVDAGKKFFNGVVDEVKKIPGKLLSLGGDIVNGLKQGISDAWNGLKRGVGDFANGVIGGFKKGLGINSPSKYTRAHGNGLVEGLVLGIKEDAKKPENLLNNVVDKLHDPIKPIGLNVYGRNGQLSNSLSIKNNERDRNKQAAIINVNTGKRTWQATVDDITHAQNLDVEMRDLYYVGG